MCFSKNILNFNSNHFFCKSCNKNYKSLDLYFNHIKVFHLKKNVYVVN